MVNEKTKLTLIAGLALLSFALYVSVSATFIVLLLGFLVVPWVLAAASTFIEGVLIANDRLNRLPHSEKESWVISDVHT